ncbi:hypothetical protein [Mesorhizobium sp.]|nr:hypothetical protein [Mesorhizobium sp.]
MTTKYAHAMVEDVLAAMEAASPTEAAAEEANGLKGLGKAG